MTGHERMPRTSTRVTGVASLDAHAQVAADPKGNRAQRRKAAKGKRRDKTTTGESTT